MSNTACDSQSLSPEDNSLSLETAPAPIRQVSNHEFMTEHRPAGGVFGSAAPDMATAPQQWPVISGGGHRYQDFES